MSCRRSKQTKQNRNTDPITLDSRVNIYESRLYVQIYTHNSYIKIFNILRIPYRYLQILKRKEKNYSIIIRIRFYPYLSYHKILFNNFIIIHIYIYIQIFSHITFSRQRFTRSEERQSRWRNVHSSPRLALDF